MPSWEAMLERPRAEIGRRRHCARSVGLGGASSLYAFSKARENEMPRRVSGRFWRPRQACVSESTVCEPVRRQTFFFRACTDLAKGRVMHLDRLQFSRRIHHASRGSARAASLTVAALLLLGCGSDDD